MITPLKFCKIVAGYVSRIVYSTIRGGMKKTCDARHEAWL